MVASLGREGWNGNLSSVVHARPLLLSWPSTIDWSKNNINVLTPLTSGVSLRSSRSDTMTVSVPVMEPEAQPR